MITDLKRFKDVALVLVLALATMLLSVMVLDALYLERYVLFGFLTMGLLAAPILIRPQMTYWVYFASIFISFNYVDRFIAPVPVILRWTTFLILLLSVVIVVVNPSKRISITRSIPNGAAWILMLFSFAAIISALINTSGVIQFVLSLRWLFMLVIAMVITQFFFKESDRDTLLKWVVRIGMLNLLVGIVQRILFVWTLKLGSGDMVAGLFSGYRDLVFYQIFCVIVVTAYWIKGKRVIPNWHPYTVISILLLTLAISNSRASWIYLTICVLVLFALAGRAYFIRSVQTIVPVILVIFISLLAFDSIMTSDYDKRESFGYLTDVNFMVFYIFGEDIWNPEMGEDGSLARGQAVIFNLNLIREGSWTLAFGFGPGAMSRSGAGTAAEGNVYADFASQDLSRNSLARLLGENGVIGLSLYFAFLVALYRGRTETNQPREELVLIRKTTGVLALLMLLYYNLHLSELYPLLIGIMYYSDVKSSKS